MKIELDMSVLKSALARVGMAVQARAPMPVLSHVLLIGEGDSLTMRGTDLDVGISVTVGCSVLEGGTVAVPYDRLRNVVSNRDSRVCIESADTATLQRVRISAGSFKHLVPCLSAEEFPPLSEPREDKSTAYGAGSVDGEVLAEALESVRLFASRDENRALICGVNFESSDGRLLLTATDGRRMARYGVPSAIELPRLTLPTRSAEALLRLLPEKGDVSIAADERMVQFVCGDCVMVSKLVEGTYPNAGQVITKALADAEVFTTVDCAEAKFSLDRVGQITEGSRVDMECADGVLTVSACTKEAEEATDTVEAKGEGFGRFSVNASFVSSAMSSVPGDRVSVASRDENSGFVMQSVDGLWLAVIMPLRLN